MLLLCCRCQWMNKWNYYYYYYFHFNYCYSSFCLWSFGFAMNWIRNEQTHAQIEMEWKFISSEMECVLSFLLRHGWRDEYKENEQIVSMTQLPCVWLIYFYSFSNHRHRMKKSTTAKMVSLLSLSAFFLFLSFLSLLGIAAWWLVAVVFPCLRTKYFTFLSFFARPLSWWQTAHSKPLPSVKLFTIFMSAMVGLVSRCVRFFVIVRCEAQIASLMEKKYRYVNHFTWFNKCGAEHTHMRQQAAPNSSEQWRDK